MQSGMWRHHACELLVIDLALQKPVAGPVLQSQKANLEKEAADRAAKRTGSQQYVCEVRVQRAVLRPVAWQPRRQLLLPAISQCRSSAPLTERVPSAADQRCHRQQRGDARAGPPQRQELQVSTLQSCCRWYVTCKSLRHAWHPDEPSAVRLAASNLTA